MKRHNILVDAGGSNDSFLIETFESIKSEHDRIASIVERYKCVQKRRGAKDKVEEECWSLSSADMLKGSDLQPPFLRKISALHASITQHLPEIMSRIMFAAASLYTELSRGYFAPLCTVALGCISRIRVLLLQFGRDAVVQFHKTVGLLETEFLAMALNGGQLEKQTGLSVESVKAFLGQDKLDLDFMNKFMDTNHHEHSMIMKQRRMEKIMQRGESTLSSMSELTKDVQIDGNQSSSEIESQDRPDYALHDIIGELVETSSAANSGVEAMEKSDFMVKKDEGDRNHELVKLMKEQSKIMKDKSNKRKAPKVLDTEGRYSKLPKVSEKEVAILSEDKGLPSEGTEEIERSKKKKDKSKKKKKQRSKDVIDAIFDKL
jgi:hypothetical protein